MTPGNPSTPTGALYGLPHSTSYDPFDPRTLADPYPALRALRRAGRVHRITTPSCWVLGHHADVVAALGDPTRFSSVGGNGAESRSSRLMVGLDPPEHAGVRRAVARAITGATMAHLEDAVAETARAVVARACARSNVDAVTDVADPLAIETLSTLLGLPAERLSGLRRGHSFRTTTLAARWRAAFRDHIAERPSRAGRDLVSRLVADTSAGALTRDEIVDVCLLLVVAAWDTPRDLVASVMLELDSLNEQLFEAREQQRIPSLAEELVRYVSPVQSVFRTVVEPVVVGETVVPTGARVMLSLASANRDEAVWERPDAIVPDRFAASVVPAHVGFGAGPHVCIGARLARMQLAALLGELADRGIETTLTGPPKWGAIPWFRRVRRGPIELSARAHAA
jgi:cytochrome P450